MPDFVGIKQMNKNVQISIHIQLIIIISLLLLNVKKKFSPPCIFFQLTNQSLRYYLMSILDL